MDKNEQKHFKVVYGKVFGIPTGSATPITDEGNRIFKKHFNPFIAFIFIALLSMNFITNPAHSIIVFILCWFAAAFTIYLFIRQLKHTATFERQYFFKKNNEDE